MVRKKRGSSLVFVVVIFSILVTVGTAMLSMTIGDYKIRINESEKIKNLYSSESGLDVAHDILIKTFDAAAKYGVGQVEIFKKSDEFIINVAKDLKQDLKDEEKHKKDIEASDDKDKSSEIRNCNKIIDELKQKIKIEEDKAIDLYFKKKFNEFVYMDKRQNDVSKINNSVNNDEIRKCIKDKKYIHNVDKNADDERYEDVTFNTDNTIDLLVDGNEEGDNKGIDFTEVPVSADAVGKYPTRRYTIKITSKYVTDNKNDRNERKLQSIYDMIVPDYKDVAFIESNPELPKYTFMDNEAIIVGNKMDVKDSNISIDGNVFVGGDTDGYNDVDGDKETRAYDKYNGGIVLDAASSKSIIFNGDVITGKTFNIRSNVNTTIKGNLYAMNVYAGSEHSGDDLPQNSKLNVVAANGDGGEVIVDNDMALKADSTTITTDKFYGINDKNIKYNDETGADGINKADKPLGRTSSSIIVNGHKGSNIKINTEAYIMGVAHIDTASGYSTGESTGVKGNYIAYAVPQNDDDKFNYNNNALQLIDEDNVIKKSDHFVSYWEDKLGSIDTGGIDLPIKTADHPERNTYSLGAIVYKDSNNNTQITGGSYKPGNIPAVINDKRKEFASKVYNIGGKSLNDNEKKALYDSLGNDKNKVSDLMDISGANDDYKKANKIFFKEYDDDADKIPDEAGNNEKAIFSDKNIKIQDSDENEIVRDGDGITINVNSNNTLNAFIVTSGNITIDGKVKVNGNIIAQGNLTINSGIEETSIKYDKELLDRIQASHAEIFNSVFGNMRNDSNGNSKADNTSSLSVQYDLNKFLKNKLWKIIK